MSNTEKKALLKPFTYVAFANIVTKPLWALLFIYAARELGAEKFGVYTFSVSLTALLSVFFDLGLDYITVRSISKEANKVNNYFNEVLFLRIIIFFILLVFLILPVFHYHDKQQYAANILILVFQFMTILLAFLKSISSAFQEFNFFAQMLIWEKVIVIVLGFTALIISNDLLLFLSFLIAGNIITIVLFFIKLRKRYLLSFIIPSINALKKLLKEALPFFLLNVFFMIYFRIDVMFLDYYSQNKSIVGIYGSLHRLIEMYLLIPSIMMTAAFPIISKYKDEDEPYSINIANIIITFQIVVSVIFSVIIAFNSYYINKLLFGSEYLSGSEGLKYIIWTCIPIGLNYILGNLLVSVRKEKLTVISVALAAGLNIILNFLLTPRYSFIATSIIALVTELFILSFYSYFVLKHFGQISLLNLFIKAAAVIASCIIIFVIYTKFIGYNFFILTAILSIIMLLMFWRLNLLKVSYFKSLLSSRYGKVTS